MRKTVLLAGACAALLFPLFAEAETDGHAKIQVQRAAGSISVDGDLSDPGWAGAARVDQWWETNPGDNTEPKVKSVGYLTYDDKFFYAAFEFSDPEPSKVRAPYGDHDNVSGNLDDYAGVILDTRNDGKTAMMFLANPRGIQYDAISDDTSGNEDNSPDFYWDSAGRITKDGWTLEIRIPFSSLRYNQGDPQEWGVLLYRNRPRERRYQMFANKIPRGSNCF
ncbi:MAG TPA: carbohydrate binding family 9 domain-containing protein, partial [Thermoanaerobaculia bacterium]|nr:carbohydrate binding family 9 domain-containing protein [Thermoanaerobaculia bacterium]